MNHNPQQNMDPTLVTHPDGVIATMKNYYPECLQLLLICNANIVFRCVRRQLSQCMATCRSSQHQPSTWFTDH